MTRKPPRHMPRQPASPGHLIPSAEMFDRVLPGRIIIDADLSFEERVERAWRRLKSQFQEDEQAKMRAMLIDIITTRSHLTSPHRT
jgi:hypothetical protein